MLTNSSAGNNKPPKTRKFLSEALELNQEGSRVTQIYLGGRD